jgi:hypothetical protein
LKEGDVAFAEAARQGDWFSSLTVRQMIA